MTSRLGTGKWQTFFYSVGDPPASLDQPEVPFERPWFGDLPLNFFLVLNILKLFQMFRPPNTYLVYNFLG